jgi:chromosome partitioning protein
MLKVLVSSPKGGVGKTTLTRNLAVAAALEGRRVGVVDFDPQQSLAHWGRRRPDQVTPLEIYSGRIEEAEEFLTNVKADSLEVLFIDTAPGIENSLAPMTVLIKAADFVLVPVQPYTDDLLSVAEWMLHLKALRCSAGFILNRVNRRARSVLTARRYLADKGRLCPVEIPQLEAFGDAATLGVSILEMAENQGKDDLKSAWGFLKNELQIA